MSRFEVGLWSGAGYQLSIYEVDADCEEEALEKAVVQVENEGSIGLFWDEVEDLEKFEELGEVLYVDATMEGAMYPHYVDATNLRIRRIENEKETNQV